MNKFYVMSLFALAGLVVLARGQRALAQPGVSQPGIMMYEDDDFKGTPCPIRVNENVPKLDGRNFGDQADSIRWCLIPAGRCAVLFESDNYRKPRFIISSANGSNRKLDGIKFGDEIDSIGWYTPAQIRQNFKGVPILR